MLWQHVPYSLRYSRNSCMHGLIPWMFCVETHHCCWISPFLTEWFTDPDVQAQVDLVSWGSEADLPQQLCSSWPPVLRLVPQRNHKGWGWIVSFLRKDPLTPPTVSPALTRAAAPLQCVSPPPSWHDHSCRDPCDVTHAGCWGEGRVHCASVPGMKIDEHTNKSWYVFLWVQVEWKKKTSIVLPVLLF